MTTDFKRLTFTGLTLKKYAGKKHFPGTWEVTIIEDDKPKISYFPFVIKLKPTRMVVRDDKYWIEDGRIIENISLEQITVAQHGKALSAKELENFAQEVH